jgi:hypothetical protein
MQIKNGKKIKSLNLLSLIIFLLIDPVYADIGPKPQMDFKIVYETSKPISIIEAKQMECQDKECLSAKPLEKVGPQGFECIRTRIEDICGSLAYGYAPYHKLVFKFTDRIRESNVFPTDEFYGKYTVTVTDSALVVKPLSVNSNPR